MSRPDFLIVGAMKCGTTTLAAQLARQDGIFMTTPKEPNFFSDDDVFARGLGWYEALFAGAAPGELRGEASTHYTKLPTYPHTIARMAGVLNDPRIVYMIRDPVERAISHYIHEWSLGRMEGDLAAAVDRHPELVDYGRYAMQITPFVAAFGPANVFLTSLEQLKARPGDELARVAAFAGLGTPAVWQADLGAQNVSAERYRRLPFHGLLVDNPVAAALRRTLVPKAVRERIRKSRSMETRPDVPDAVRRRLEAAFAEDRARLAELFPGHPALTEAYPFVRAA